MISSEIAAYSLCLEPRTLGERPLPFFIFIYLYGTPGEIRTHVKRFRRPLPDPLDYESIYLEQHVEFESTLFQLGRMVPYLLGECCKFGAAGRSRILDPLITNQVLYQLSYVPI